MVHWNPLGSMWHPLEGIHVYTYVYIFIYTYYTDIHRWYNFYFMRTGKSWHAQVPFQVDCLKTLAPSFLAVQIWFAHVLLVIVDVSSKQSRWHSNTKQDSKWSCFLSWMWWWWWYPIETAFEGLAEPITSHDQSNSTRSNVLPSEIRTKNQGWISLPFSLGKAAI